MDSKRLNKTKYENFSGLQPSNLFKKGAQNIFCTFQVKNAYFFLDFYHDFPKKLGCKINILPL